MEGCLRALWPIRQLQFVVTKKCDVTEFSKLYSHFFIRIFAKMLFFFGCMVTNMEFPQNCA